MPIGQDQVLVAVEIVVEKAQPKGQRLQRCLHQPSFARSIDEDLAAGLAIERERLAAKVANGDGEYAVVGDRGNIYAHPRSRTPSLVVANARGETPLRKAASTYVLQQEIGLGVVGDDQVDAAVIFKVSHGHAHGLALGQ